MHWVILADAAQKNEIAGKFSPDAKVDWVADAGSFIKYDADVFVDLGFDNSQPRKQLLKKLKGCVIVNSVANTISEMKFACLRINGWPGFLKNDLWEIAGDKDLLPAGYTNDIEVSLKWVEDVPGFVSARIIAMLVNEAFLTNEEKISSREDIDIAMKTGTNYPYGPFEWSRIIGTENITQLLERLSLQDPLYRPATSLKSESN